MSGRLELIWEGEVVGAIEDLQIDNTHWYGQWKPSASLRTSQFVQAVEQAIRQWEEDNRGIDCYMAPEGSKVVEVTSFDGSRIEILINPSRWYDEKPKRWWQFWQR
jgi:hypothetical protein